MPGIRFDMQDTVAEINLNNPPEGLAKREDSIHPPPQSGFVLQTVVYAEPERGIIPERVHGRGKRFFQDRMDATRLELLSSKTLGLGVIVLRYQPASN